MPMVFGSVGKIVFALQAGREIRIMKANWQDKSKTTKSQSGHKVREKIENNPFTQVKWRTKTNQDSLCLVVTGDIG